MKCYLDTCKTFRYEIPSKTIQLLHLPNELLVIIAQYAISPNEVGYDRQFNNIQIQGSKLIGLNHRLRRITAGLHDIQDWKAAFEWSKNVGFDTMDAVYLNPDGSLHGDLHLSNGHFEMNNGLIYAICLHAMTSLANKLSKKHRIKMILYWSDVSLVEDFVEYLIRGLDALTNQEPNVKLSLASLALVPPTTWEYDNRSDIVEDVPICLYQLYRRLAPLTLPDFKLTAPVRCLHCHQNIVSNMSQCFYCDWKDGRLYCDNCLRRNKDFIDTNAYPNYAKDACCSECVQTLAIVQPPTQ